MAQRSVPGLVNLLARPELGYADKLAVNFVSINFRELYGLCLAPLSVLLGLIVLAFLALVSLLCGASLKETWRVIVDCLDAVFEELNNQFCRAFCL